MFQGQHHLDQRRNTGIADRVSNVGLDRANPAKLPLIRMGAKRFGDSFDLNGIPELSAGAVRLDVGDRLRVDSGHLPRHLQDLCLSIGIRRGDPVRLTIIIDGAAFDYRPDRVAIPQCLFQGL
ncbi:hypothetical protein ABE386_21405 [Brevibacillus brevis]|nr:MULTISPECIES: hypothetical protein [Brevibacillus]